MRFAIFLVSTIIFIVATYIMPPLSGFEKVFAVLLVGILTILILSAYILTDISDNIKNLRYNK